MVKKPNKKGFTLVEMMVVIVIIAILVAVIIPVVNHSTIKSRAAANAANLRAIEGQVAMHMLLNEGVYDEFIKDSDNINAVSNTILGKIYNFFKGEGAAETFAGNFKALWDNGKGEIPVPNSSPIPNVARAKALKAPNRSGKTAMVVDEEYMCVYITEDGALAFYGDWTKEDFADVAEDGIYDGTTVGTTRPDGGGTSRLEVEICISQGKHTPGPNCECKTCGGEAHWGADAPRYETSTTRHLCENNHIINDEHVYVKVDNTYHKCSLCGDAAENKEHNWGNNKCTICGAEKPQCQVGFCHELAFEDTGYCGDHQLTICGQPVDRNGGTCQETIPNGTTCPKASDHVLISTCPYPGCGGLASPHLNGGMCYKHGGYQQCAKGHWYNTDYCEECNTDYNCAFSGCQNTVKVMGDYCTTVHYARTCQKLAQKSRLGYTYYETCGKEYRDPNATGCGATHYKQTTCGCTKGSTISLGWFGSIAGQCGQASCKHSHKEGETCRETVYVVDNS